MPDDDAEIAQKCREMAAAIVVSRSVFEQLYDPVIEAKIPDALQFRALSVLRDRQVPNLTGKAKDQADFAEALRQANKFNRLFDFFAKHASKLFADTQQPSVTLQSIINLKQTFPKAELVTSGRIAALRRVCRILCETGPGVEEKGSGFLIGPHLVLTNWHVVKSVLEDSKEKKDSQRRMKFEFDALVRADGSVEKLDVFRPVEHWLVIAREAHKFETAGGGQGQNGPWPDNPDELAEKLDFAVIELDGAPGYDRGWYKLEEAPWPQADTALDLFQFPLGRAMTYLTEKFVAPKVFHDNDKPPRILHLVNTERGSSGGLCLDLASSNAVALHQAGYEFKNGKNSEGADAEIATINAAIPLAFIASIAGQTVKDRIASAPRIVRSGPNGAPILGRQKFQNLVDGALRGNIRIVTVQTSFDQNTSQPRPKIGKSFSESIMRALLPAPDNVIFSLTSARLTSDAYAAARLIVETVNPQDLGKVPTAPTGQTSLDADAIGMLITPVIGAMRAAAGDGVLWLVIDDLDRNPVMSESTTSTLLNALYKAAASQSKLRIVLIGPTGVLPGLTGLPSGADLVEEHISDRDVAAWITGELGSRMPVLPQFANLMADIARSVADDLAKDPLKGRTGAIAQVLQAHWAPKIQVQ